MLLMKKSQQLQYVRDGCTPHISKRYLHVTSSNKFPSNIELWNGWPLREVFDSLSNCVVRENIHGVKIHVKRVENLDSSVAEATLRKQLASLHEQEDRVIIDQGLDTLLSVAWGLHQKIIRHEERRGGGGHCLRDSEWRRRWNKSISG